VRARAVLPSAVHAGPYHAADGVRRGACAHDASPMPSPFLCAIPPLHIHGARGVQTSWLNRLHAADVLAPE